MVLNPLEGAVHTVCSKTRELRQRIREAAALPDREAPQAFTMLMNGVVDAAVSGGVANYYTFFTNEYRATHPEVAADVDSTPSKRAAVHALRAALREQVAVVAQGIDVHRVKCAEAMVPLHQHLAGRFVELKLKLAGLGVL